MLTFDTHRLGGKTHREPTGEAPLAALTGLADECDYAAHLPFVKAARKQRKALADGWGHALHCNYQRPEGNGEYRCNCGVADVMKALDDYERATGNPPNVKSVPPADEKTPPTKSDVYEPTD